MILLLLILIPLLTGLLCFAARGAAKGVALAGSLATLVLAAYAATSARVLGAPDFDVSWIPQLGARLILHADPASTVLSLLTGLVFTVIVVSSWNKPIDRPHNFWGLMMLSAAGLMGVFLAYDALMFYFFWELALVPVYFLCSGWGGERRIPVTFKFFVYTFAGSLLMLAGIIFLSIKAGGQYSWPAITEAGTRLDGGTQSWLFWLLFAAFAIKMPVFPFHTWQPDTYQTSPTPVTIVLSAVMVKMGLFAALRWLLPVVPAGAAYWADAVTALAVIGIVYASCVAIVQTDMKRLIAYSSIAHMGLMVAGMFAGFQPGAEGAMAGSTTAMNGLILQMFNHGIIVAGLWVLVSLVESRYGTRDMKVLGGMSTAAPQMAIALLILCFANVSLPLTSGFVGEFMLFHGIFQSASPYRIIFMVVAGTGIILSAVYTLTMAARVAFGTRAEGEGNATPALAIRDLTLNEWIGLGAVIALIVFLGVYPQPLLRLTEGFTP